MTRTFRLMSLAAGAALLISAADHAGYIAPDAIDLTTVLPPAPTKGDIRYEADRKMFKAMKAMVGTPRWDAATRDAAYDTPTMLQDFSCAAGVTLSPEATPATYRLLVNASTDTGAANNIAKDRYKRLRPYHIDHGAICQPAKELGDSFDYPSGHTTKGWTFGLVLAEAMPDHAAMLLARGREYGESRIVCRVHNMSAVEAGRLGAGVTMTAIRATPAYQADLMAAKAELAAARLASAPPEGSACAAEQALLGPSVLAGLTR